MAINKIIKLGLEEKANELKAQGLSDYKIAEELQKYQSNTESVYSSSLLECVMIAETSWQQYGRC